MGAWAFHGFQEKLNSTKTFAEILPIELPGRNSRMMEDKPESMEDTVSAMVSGLASSGVLEKSYILVGHSLGAWMAYEAARIVCARKLPKPKALVVSGARAAHLAAICNDADAAAPALASLPTSQLFWEHFERRYGKNPDLQSALVKDYVEPLLRADFRLLETYRPPATKLPVPILACGARGDNRFTIPQLQAWSELTSAQFDMRLFDVKPLPWSTPHRYIVEDPQPLINLLEELALKITHVPLGAHVVVTKNGALVREGIELDSRQVMVLKQGALCNVVEIVHDPPKGGRPRARLDAPADGWLSLHVITPKAET